MRIAALFLAVSSACLAQQGFDATRLEAWRADLAKRGTKAILVTRFGKPVLEWYSADHGPSTKHYSASLAKALVGGTSLMFAMEDQRIRPDDLAARYIPSWRSDARKSKIAIRHLATHTSGIEDAEQDGIPHMKLPGWKGAFWRREPDPFTPSIRDAPVLFEPGSAWHYNNPGMAALAYAVTASLSGAPQTGIRSLLKARLFDPLGIPENEWSIGYGRAYEVDGLQLWANWGGGAFTARTVARIGEWMMKRPNQPVLRDQGLPKSDNPHAPASGLAWYTNARGSWPALPKMSFAGAGAGHQVLLVVPELDIVMVRNGANIESGLTDQRYWGAVYDHLFAPLMSALADPAYSKSQVVKAVHFQPADQIRRDADGSDNWPVTWGDDGALYTSYGDGWGFEPRTEKKLSQGWARIDGPPNAFKGTNIRSETGERTGDGRAGAKTCGLIMVDGVLYAWVRNTGNSQLVWSADRGRTWTWGFKFDVSMGAPSFLNIGRNHVGSLDEYVYMYSPDGPSAYEQAAGVVLARAPQGRIREKAAWEFRTANGWSEDIAARTPVFAYEGHVQRVDAVYHPGSNATCWPLATTTHPAGACLKRPTHGAHGRLSSTPTNGTLKAHTAIACLRSGSNPMARWP